MLKLTNITKDYSIGKANVCHALKSIDVNFRKSEFVAILGPSGSGKTTLLNIIGGLDRYDSGDLQIKGISTNKYKDRDWDTYRNHSVGFVFQSYNLIMHQSVYSNVELSLTLAGIDHKERKRMVLEALKKVGLENEVYKKPNQLSGGQMQRVAIARAIVNSPEILLADEPTGALDTENSEQIMDILKELASDRLVIMVTHNPELAERYATRIIHFADGELKGDSNPVSSEELEEFENYSAELQPTAADDARNWFLRLFSKKERDKSKGKKKYSSMSFKSAIKLSMKNLITKKVRTTATSVAGSIGIIGIALVLAISSGVKGYLNNMEEDSLSTYPLTISKNDTGESGGNFLSSIFDMLGSDDTEELDKYPNTDEIYTHEVIGGMIEKVAEMAGNKKLGENDTVTFSKYLEQNFDPAWGTISYDYGTKFNVFYKFPENGKPGAGEIRKVDPFMDVVGAVQGIPTQIMGYLEQYGDFINTWSEIYNQELLTEQYDLLGDSRWPSAENEIAIVVNEYNQIDDYALFCLGLKGITDINDTLQGSAASGNLTVDDLLALRYYVAPDAVYYKSNDDGETYYYDQTFDTNDKGQLTNLIASPSAIEVKVTAVIRPKKDVSATCISSIVGYPHALMEATWEKAKEAPVTQKVIKAEETEKGSWKTIVTPDKSYTDFDEFLISLGVANENEIQKISIYASSFENKQNILKLIEKYNDTRKLDNRSTIKYVDQMANLMSYATTMTDVISRVLIGFAAISLIVSSIMIAIITYTSVLERTKEIGVLRSLGASKKDVAHVFLAEAGIIGVISGVIGIIFTLLFSVIAKSLLTAFLGFEINVMIEWYMALILIVLSFFLSLLAGFIPSRIASKKDPVTALRSE